MVLDLASGIIAPSQHSATRRLRDVLEIFADTADLTEEQLETIVYQTYGCPGDGDGPRLLYGTTVLMPGNVNGECFMTRGHYHTNPERGELCLTLSGEGTLLLMPKLQDGTPDRERTRQEKMVAGSIHDIDGRLAHRVVNTSDVPLIFFVTWLADCGHDYASIGSAGFGVRISKA
jgi:glucose-6-phosphate isomerase